VGSRQEAVNDMASRIEALKKENFKSIAIICKTAEECSRVHSLFKKGKNSPYIITGKEKEYKSGVVIVPSYLAKGLEFDAVFVANADDKTYTADELDVKLLYVAMTRPLHRLCIYYENVLTPLLSEVVQTK
jgi:DNA helicase-2/ATP-dependent DNA helicase PcrA